ACGGDAAACPWRAGPASLPRIRPILLQCTMGPRPGSGPLGAGLSGRDKGGHNGSWRRPQPMPETQVDEHDRLYREFRWLVPARFNISTVCSTRWARDPGRIAIRVDRGDEPVETLTYARLDADANRLANALVASGVRPGDRVALLLPQCLETAIAQMAILRMGAVAMPLSILFGADAIAYRLQDSDTRTVIVDASALETLREARLEASEV